MVSKEVGKTISTGFMTLVIMLSLLLPTRLIPSGKIIFDVPAEVGGLILIPDMSNPSSFLIYILVGFLLSSKKYFAPAWSAIETENPLPTSSIAPTLSALNQSSKPPKLPGTSSFFSRNDSADVQ